jgi:macrolide transport system ATP-binding/permease protein
MRCGSADAMFAAVWRIVARVSAFFSGEALDRDFAQELESHVPVGQRAREIGVRIALGAERRTVYQLILGESSWMVGIGTTIGIVCAVAVASLMSRLLFDTQPWDVPSLAAAAVVLIVPALFASFLTARRAAAVNPLKVLREE